MIIIWQYFGQILKFIPQKLIEKKEEITKYKLEDSLKKSHVVSLIYAQLSHALSLNDICDNVTLNLLRVHFLVLY